MVSSFGQYPSICLRIGIQSLTSMIDMKVDFEEIISIFPEREVGGF